MGLFTKDIATMDDLLLHGLKDIYYAENQIIKSLPKLIDKATNRDLSKGLKGVSAHRSDSCIVELLHDRRGRALGQDKGKPGAGVEISKPLARAPTYTATDHVGLFGTKPSSPKRHVATRRDRSSAAN
jgi:Domain of unknown function (DUF892)